MSILHTIRRAIADVRAEADRLAAEAAAAEEQEAAEAEQEDAEDDTAFAEFLADAAEGKRDEDERRLWDAVYAESIKVGDDPGPAADAADLAVTRRRAFFGDGEGEA